MASAAGEIGSLKAIKPVFRLPHPPAHKHSCHAIGVTMFQKTTRPAQPAPPAKQEILDGAQVNDAQDELERYGKTPAKEYSWRQALLQAYLLV